MGRQGTAGYWRQSPHKSVPLTGSYILVRKPIGGGLIYLAERHPEGAGASEIPGTRYNLMASTLSAAKQYARRYGYNTINYPGGRIDWVRR